MTRPDCMQGRAADCISSYEPACSMKWKIKTRLLDKISDAGRGQTEIVQTEIVQSKGVRLKCCRDKEFDFHVHQVQPVQSMCSTCELQCRQTVEKTPIVRWRCALCSIRLCTLVVLKWNLTFYSQHSLQDHRCNWWTSEQVAPTKNFGATHQVSSTLLKLQRHLWWTLSHCA
jgi:hypothetical protein